MKMLKNQHGQALMSAVLLSVLIGAGLVALSIQTISLAKNTRRSRILLGMNNTKAMIDLVFQSPSSYNCSSNGGSLNCPFLNNGTMGVTNRLNSIIAATNASLCSNNPMICEITITHGPEIKYVAEKNGYFSELVLTYRSSGRAVEKRFGVSTEISNIIAQNSSFTCDRFFEGFNPDGSIKCKELAIQRAPAGQYIKSINPSTLEFELASLPTSVNDCTGADEFLMTYQWAGETRYDASCGSRINPFLLEAP